MGSGFVPGHLRLLLLHLLAERPRHGYELIAELTRRGGQALEIPEGSVYPALHRMERNGLVSSAWQSGSGRRRREYRIEPAGVQELERLRTEWRGFVAAMTRALEADPDG